MKIVSPDDAGLRRAVRWLQDAKPVGMPTETVYGLAAPFDDVTAVAAVFEAKRRPSFDPLIVHVEDPASLPYVADLRGFSVEERARLDAGH